MITVHIWVYYSVVLKKQGVPPANPSVDHTLLEILHSGSQLRSTQVCACHRRWIPKGATKKPHTAPDRVPSASWWPCDAFLRAFLCQTLPPRLGGSLRQQSAAARYRRRARRSCRVSHMVVLASVVSVSRSSSEKLDRASERRADAYGCSNTAKLREAYCILSDSRISRLVFGWRVNLVIVY